MTDRVRSLTVVLDRDFRTDDVQQVIEAIKMTKGVSDCTFDGDDVVTYEDHMARAAVSAELTDSILALIRALRMGKKWEIVVKEPEK